MRFLQTPSLLLNHRFFIVLQKILLSIIQALKHLNELCNPLIISEESPTVAPNSYNDDISAVHAFIGVTAIFGIFMMIKFIWEYWKSERKAPESADTLVEQKDSLNRVPESFEKIYNTLLRLKSQLSPASGYKKSTPRAFDSLGQAPKKKQPLSRGQLSKFPPHSKKEICACHDEVLKKSLQSILQLLEEQMRNKPQRTGTALEKLNLTKNQGTAKIWSESLDSDEEGFPSENETDDEHVGSAGEKERTELKSLAECAGVIVSPMEEAVIQQIGNNMMMEPRAASFCRLDKGNECRLESQNQQLKWRNAETKSYTVGSSNKESVLNISANKKALSIELLFNRAVRLT